MKPETREGIVLMIVGYLVIALGITIGVWVDFLWGIPFLAGGYLVLVIGVLGMEG